MATGEYPPVNVDRGEKVLALRRRPRWVRNLAWAITADRRKFVIRHNLARFDVAALTAPVMRGTPNTVWSAWEPVPGVFTARKAQRAAAVRIAGHAANGTWDVFGHWWLAMLTEREQER